MSLGGRIPGQLLPRLPCAGPRLLERFVVGEKLADGQRKPSDVAGLAEAVHELLSDREALGQAREGARRAREELTWDAAAQAHLALYEEIA